MERKGLDIRKLGEGVYLEFKVKGKSAHLKIWHHLFIMTHLDEHFRTKTEEESAIINSQIKDSFSKSGGKKKSF